MKRKILIAAKKGFTLIELMAAMAITSILVLVIVGLTSRGVDMWRMVLQDVRTTALARVAMDTMTKDFESMQIRGGNSYEWLNVQRDDDFQKKEMTMGPKAARFTNASRLIFFTKAMDRNQAMRSDESRSYREDTLARKQTAGDVSCVAYKLAYRDQILNEDATEYSTGFPVYALYRNLISPQNTYEELLGRSDLYKEYKRYESDEARPLNFLVENIVELTLIFEVEYQERKTNEGENPMAWRKIEPIPIIATGTARSGGYRELKIFGNHLDAIRQGSKSGDLTYGQVVGVTMSMTVVTDEGMVLVDQARRGRGGASAMPNQKDFFRKYTRSFSQRIDLPKPN